MLSSNTDESPTYRRPFQQPSLNSYIPLEVIPTTHLRPNLALNCEHLFSSATIPRLRPPSSSSINHSTTHNRPSRQRSTSCSLTPGKSEGPIKHPHLQHPPRSPGFKTWRLCDFWKAARNDKKKHRSARQVKRREMARTILSEGSVDGFWWRLVRLGNAVADRF